MQTLTALRERKNRSDRGVRIGRSELMRFASALMLILAVGQIAQAGRIEANAGLDKVADRSRDIMSDKKKIGTLAIDNYFSWTSGPHDGTKVTFTPENPGLKATEKKWENRGGASLEALFTQTVKDLKFEFRWIQGVLGGKGTIGTPPYLDPSIRDDGLPFYYTEKENTDALNGRWLTDIPSQAKTNAGNSINFETAFVAADLAKKEVHFLKGFTWGYEIAEKEKVGLNKFAWLDAPSDALKKLLTDWDGSDTKPYTGDSKADGWKWVEANLATKIPEPATLMIGCVALGCVLSQRPAIKRAA